MSEEYRDPQYECDLCPDGTQGAIECRSLITDGLCEMYAQEVEDHIVELPVEIRDLRIARNRDRTVTALAE